MVVFASQVFSTALAFRAVLAEGGHASLSDSAEDGLSSGSEVTVVSGHF